MDIDYISNTLADIKKRHNEIGFLFDIICKEIAASDCEESKAAGGNSKSLTEYLNSAELSSFNEGIRVITKDGHGVINAITSDRIAKVELDDGGVKDYVLWDLREEVNNER
jgi:hypothetical protein